MRVVVMALLGYGALAPGLSLADDAAAVREGNGVQHLASRIQQSARAPDFVSFESARLADVVAIINRYNRQQLAIGGTFDYSSRDCSGC